ncbi:RecX family transcriptional regulator [Labrenzia sp. 011]|uniref:regulatory protein RecX n=1 Tax=Labrenzia sp. 011 TaxID=2171494 RepID=UPI000D50673D|nr:RecX family transcriptional regulator [Labrenzia sp. 011]PVB62775.1 RecX family transcriptional regulator [Labrenzia sp. 011]
MPDKPRYKIPTEDRLTRSAVHYLERYASSAANLRKVLERKVLKACMAHERDPGEFSALIDAVVEKCCQSGLVNDLAYAETKTAGLRRRGGSRRKIEAKLSAKGVDRDIIRTVLNNDGQDDLSAAFIFARRRRLGPFRTDDKDRRDKDMAALCRAGFSYDVARRVIEATKEDLRAHEART